MNILIVDDEPGALHQIASKVEALLPDACICSDNSPERALEWAKTNPCEIAFLDIQMGAITGIELGKRLKELTPKINLIFVTAYLEYALPAHSLRASGYLLKPATSEAIRMELDNLRYPMPKPPTQKRLSVQCFGNFEVFCDGVPLRFSRSKTKELFAVLVDRNGASVNSGEICAKLWENAGSDKREKDYFRHLVSDLMQTLQAVGEEQVVVRAHNSYAVAPKLLTCDYYDYLNSVPYAVRAYQGEYMTQYSWAEGRISSAETK